MKKILSFVLIFLLIASTAFAIPSKQGTISATDTSASTVLGGYHVIIVNDGANEVFLAFNKSSATTSDFKLNSGESVTLDSNDRIDNVSTICSAAETATLRFVTWN